MAKSDWETLKNKWCDTDADAYMSLDLIVEECEELRDAELKKLSDIIERRTDALKDSKLPKEAKVAVAFELGLLQYEIEEMRNGQ